MNRNPDTADRLTAELAAKERADDKAAERADMQRREAAPYVDRARRAVYSTIVHGLDREFWDAVHDNPADLTDVLREGLRRNPSMIGAWHAFVSYAKAHAAQRITDVIDNTPPAILATVLESIASDAERAVTAHRVGS